MGGLHEYLAGENTGPGGGETEVTQLRRELLEATKLRRDAVELCQQWMSEINREYDQLASNLNRRIRRLEGEQVVEPATQPKRERRVRRRTPDMSGTENWTAEEIAHFKELINK